MVSRRLEKREETYSTGDARGKWSNSTERGDIIRKRELMRKKTGNSGLRGHLGFRVNFSSI